MTAQIENRSGGCLCGAVRIQIAACSPELHACHCSMCRRLTGSCFMSITAPASAVTITGQKAVATYASSDWASRSFCRHCGSTLWYRMTGSDDADYELSAGLLDDQSGLQLVDEIYVDSKPDAYSFAQPTRKMTGAEVEALYSSQPKE